MKILPPVIGDIHDELIQMIEEYEDELKYLVKQNEEELRQQSAAYNTELGELHKRIAILRLALLQFECPHE